MKKRLIILFSSLVLVTFGTVTVSHTTVIEASSATPYNWRGTYKNYGNGDVMRITAHYIHYVGHTHKIRAVKVDPYNGVWKVVHFYHAYPVYIHKNAYSNTLHFEYGMSVRVTYHKY